MQPIVIKCMAQPIGGHANTMALKALLQLAYQKYAACNCPVRSSRALNTCAHSPGQAAPIFIRSAANISNRCL